MGSCEVVGIGASCCEIIKFENTECVVILARRACDDDRGLGEGRGGDSMRGVTVPEWIGVKSDNSEGLGGEEDRNDGPSPKSFNSSRRVRRRRLRRGGTEDPMFARRG
jgi:hypothetical protein